MEAGNFSLINWGGSLVGCREDEQRACKKQNAKELTSDNPPKGMKVDKKVEQNGSRTYK
jgi:hypothetical protein